MNAGFESRGVERKRHCLKFVVAASALLLAASLVLLLASCGLDPTDHHVSFSDSFHVGVGRRGADLRIFFFNDSEYGPYQGSVIGIIDADGNVYPPLEREEAFGDAWGIYYRYFQWSDATLWTLAVSLWYPIAFFAIAPAAWLLRRSTRRPGVRGRGSEPV